MLNLYLLFQYFSHGMLKFKSAALIIHEFLEPHWKSLSYILLQGLNKDCFHTVIFVLWLGWWMEDKKIDSITASLTECRGKSRICLYGRQGAGWRTKRLGIVFVFLWCWILWGWWDGSVWRGWRETDRRERLFSLIAERKKLFMLAQYVSCLSVEREWQARCWWPVCVQSKGPGPAGCVLGGAGAWART